MARKLTLTTLLCIYALLLAYTIGALALGEIPSKLITPFTTLVGFTYAILHAVWRLGWERSLILLALVFGISLLFESIGVATGWIYGPYHYSHKLGPLFLGLVPWLIPVAWFMMMYPSLVVAEWLVPIRWSRWQRLLVVASIGGLVMTAWDVIMDPIMAAGGHWIWEVDGAFFGIPLQNFFGWWLTTFTTFALFMLLDKRWSSAIPDGHFDRMAVILYVLTGLGNIIVALMSEFLAGAALAGILAMTPWVLTGWLRMGQNTKA